jgi:hypothetical protein
MYAPPDHWPGQPGYHARLEVHLGEGTQVKIEDCVTSFGQARAREGRSTAAARQARHTASFCGLSPSCGSGYERRVNIP